MSNFNHYSTYYDLLYSDKDYKAESDYVYDMLKHINPAVHEVLELGCGSGNHAFYLSKNNINITGIERSETMVHEAQTKNIPNFNPMLGDITHFELPQTFDATISLFHVISYLTLNESLLSCFACVNKHLQPKGLFLFDIWFTPAVYTQQTETRVKRLENETISVVRIAESTVDFISNIVTVDYEVHIKNKVTQQSEIIKESHPMRHFSIPELQLLARLTGFELLLTEEFLTKKTASATTWGICVVFQKI